MLRTMSLLGFVAALATLQGAVVGEPSTDAPRVCYELKINGESFQVEANRETTLESKKQPGVHYRVALRVAPTQPMQLNSIAFDYDLPAKVEVDKRDPRTARIAHELGFSALLTDLGRPLDSREQQEMLKSLVASVTSTLGEMHAQGVLVAEPHERAFKGSSARGTTVRYRDAKGFEHVYLLYVLTGPKHAATCVVQYLDHDSDDALPLIKKILDSVRSVSSNR